ncbi:MAG: GNAT family N-acetyltransferase [Lachnospiraceae bacterium]|nr:GNAT family N-acetyltransferase [Lachnospiraceae bacterium]
MENITAEKLFAGWEETLIWSCLQGVMGKVYTNKPNENAAMAMLGDFVFFAGKPSEKFRRYTPENCKQNFIIMVPQNDEWSALIEQVYKEKAKKVIRYAFKKEPDIFDKDKLEKVVGQLPADFEIKLIEESEFSMCQENDWSRDLVSQFEDYEMYKKLGLGVVILHNGELVAGASSYARYREGIEIEIDTRQDYRRKGLAYISGAKLILECLNRNLYPSWDAQNLWSVALAEKLGYHFSHEYTAYEIMNY